MPHPLRVMTYNICDGGQDRLALIQQVIASAAPQLVLLNEADDEQAVIRLAQALGMTHLWARGSGTKHIALLSRFPVVRWKIYNQRPITQALLQVELDTDGRAPLTIYGVHLLPYYMLLPYEVARWRSVKAILRVTAAQPPSPHLILGDFNAVSPGEPVDLTIFPAWIQRLMRLQANRFVRLALRPLAQAKYTDVFRALHPSAQGRTWMPTHLSARLDYIFADPLLAPRLQSCQVVTADPADAASDHYGLIADFDA